MSVYEPKPRYRWDAVLHAWVLQSSFQPFLPMVLFAPFVGPCGYVYTTSDVIDDSQRYRQAWQQSDGFDWKRA